MLQVDNLSFQYKRGTIILDELSFTANAGECLAILGNNGAGKSTLLKCLNKILRPQTGTVYLEDTSLLNLSNKELAKHMAFVDQQSPESQLSVFDTILLGRRPYLNFVASKKDKDLVQSLLNDLNLEDLAFRPVNELSGGERQKIMFARALAQQPKVLLMDEPTSSLDLRNKCEVLSLTRKVTQAKSMITIVILHDLNLSLEYCDRFLLMKDHQIYAAGDQSIITSEAIEATYGLRVNVHELDGRKLVVPIGV
ncbi:iron complex transport system ATP-binding protein [Lachnospiraceae bacterium PM6-15]|uniref:ABC transporter ATP-binding protein n=1 Tax=Ohessyouella blattaphilus TaxID=2949333 RepID=UPI003E1F9953